MVDQRDGTGNLLVVNCYGTLHCKRDSVIWEYVVVEGVNCHGEGLHSVSNSGIEAITEVLFSEIFVFFIAVSCSAMSLIV